MDDLRGSGDGMAFRAYSVERMVESAVRKSGGQVRSVARLTRDLVETYQKCNPSFRYSEAWNPKRYLTSPSVGVLNDGYDNDHSDLILYVNLVLINNETKRRYVVKDILGQGTFGQVVKCLNLENGSYVAVKVIKNQPAYYQQAVVEVKILHMLNQKFDPNDKHHIVRILDYFVFQHHLCISFEMLGSNLYELMKLNSFKGLSLNIVQMFSKQILHALVVMKDAGIIHCDLKPENILISTSTKPTEIKVIDFGSACMEGHTVYSYIQSRYYRSPEVLLGYPYSTSIDMWSFGCIVAELFLGLPLFPGASEYDLLKRMIEILGGHPPDYLLRNAKNTSKFFKHVRSVYHLDHDANARDSVSAYQILTEAEYESRESKPPLIGKRYFNFVKIEDIITNYPYRKNLRDDEVVKENRARLALVDFLRGLVEFDPMKRWSPLQASGHPFVTGEPFVSPYRPPPETPRIPVMHTVTVDHNPGGGHWLAAGLSPQVSNATKCLPHNNPYFHKIPMSYSSSYGSLGSHGSYNDNAVHCGSYGSYGDNNSLHAYYSSVGSCGYSIRGPIGGVFLGSSPDARQRPQLSHGSGFGLSPGGLGPMSLGASPSQFTPPSSQMHILSASPGKYGPTSPRGNLHGGSLSKAAAVAQYNKRRNWEQSHESMAQHGHAHCGDGICSSYSDTQYHGHAGSHPAGSGNHGSWRRQMGGGNALSSSYSATHHQKFTTSHHLGSNTNLRSSEVSCSKLECSPPVLDPADWDPNYSDESFLQEDDADALNIELSNALHLRDTRENAIMTKGLAGSGYHPVHTSTNLIANQRPDSLLPAYSVNESNPSTTQDSISGHGRLPHFSQKNPSRLGQQSIHRHNFASSSTMRGERIHQQYGQSAHSNYNMADSHSSTNPMFSSSMPWGRKFGQSIATTLPSHHSRTDYGGIS